MSAANDSGGEGLAGPRAHGPPAPPPPQERRVRSDTDADLRMLAVTLVGTLAANLLTGLFVVLAFVLLKQQKHMVCGPNGLNSGAVAVYGTTSCHLATDWLLMSISTGVAVACLAAATTLRRWWPWQQGGKVNIQGRIAQVLLAALAGLGVLQWLALAGGLRTP